MIFIDSGIPMYLVGAPHPNKDAALRVLNALLEAGERLVSDVEVLEEILHRYTSIDRRDAIQPAFDALLGIVDELYAIDLATSSGPGSSCCVRPPSPLGRRYIWRSCSATGSPES